MERKIDVFLSMTSDARVAFNTLLQHGVFITGPGGLTVRQFLNRVMGFDNECIDQRVRTIFHNCSPMDGIDETHLKDGDRLALGSAMPGLVGICMGRDNPYKSFRSDISSDKIEDKIVDSSARIFVKVFSVLAVETGESLWKSGIEVGKSRLLTLLNKEKNKIIPGEGQSVDDIIDQFTGGEPSRSA